MIRIVLHDSTTSIELTNISTPVNGLAKAGSLKIYETRYGGDFAHVINKASVKALYRSDVATLCAKVWTNADPVYFDVLDGSTYLFRGAVRPNVELVDTDAADFMTIEALDVTQFLETTYRGDVVFYTYGAGYSLFNSAQTYLSLVHLLIGRTPLGALLTARGETITCPDPQVFYRGSWGGSTAVNDTSFAPAVFKLSNKDQINTLLSDLLKQYGYVYRYKPGVGLILDRWAKKTYTTTGGEISSITTGAIRAIKKITVKRSESKEKGVSVEYTKVKTITSVVALTESPGAVIFQVAVGGSMTPRVWPCDSYSANGVMTTLLGTYQHNHLMDGTALDENVLRPYQSISGAQSYKYTPKSLTIVFKFTFNEHGVESSEYIHFMKTAAGLVTWKNQNAIRARNIDNRVSGDNFTVWDQFVNIGAAIEQAEFDTDGVKIKIKGPTSAGAQHLFWNSQFWTNRWTTVTVDMVEVRADVTYTFQGGEKNPIDDMAPRVRVPSSSADLSLLKTVQAPLVTEKAIVETVAHSVNRSLSSAKISWDSLTDLPVGSVNQYTFAKFSTKAVIVEKVRSWTGYVPMFEYVAETVEDLSITNSVIAENPADETPTANTDMYQREVIAAAATALSMSGTLKTPISSLNLPSSSSNLPTNDGLYFFGDLLGYYSRNQADYTFKVDKDGNFHLGNVAGNKLDFDVDTGVLGLTGTFNVSGSSTISGSLSTSNGKINLASDGTLTALKGNIGGFTLADTSLTSSYLTLDSVNGLTTTKGSIAGWTFDSDVLKSDSTTGKRIELRKSKNRISIFDNTNTEKVAMGYLEGLINPKDGTTLGSSTYGFWALAGNTIDFKADINFSGSQILNDSSLDIKNGLGTKILRYGTDSGTTGFLAYNSSGVLKTILSETGLELGNGIIRINPTNALGNFDEGIRIARAANGYSTITLGASPTSVTGYQAYQTAVASSNEGDLQFYVKETGTYNAFQALTLQGGQTTVNTETLLTKRILSQNGNDSYTLYGPNTVWSSFLMVGATSNTTANSNTAKVISTNGNLHLDSAIGYVNELYLNFYSRKKVGVYGTTGINQLHWEASGSRVGYTYADGGGIGIANSADGTNYKELVYLNNAGNKIDFYANGILGASINQGGLVLEKSENTLIGIYDASKTRGLYSIGVSYPLPSAPSGGKYGSFHGIAYSYDPNYGGAGNNPQSITGLGHQALFMANGETKTAIGTGIYTTGQIVGTCGFNLTGGINITNGSIISQGTGYITTDQYIKAINGHKGAYYGTGTTFATFSAMVPNVGDVCFALVSGTYPSTDGVPALMSRINSTTVRFRYNIASNMDVINGGNNSTLHVWV